jgi:hypothetical protein
LGFGAGASMTFSWVILFGHRYSSAVEVVILILFYALCATAALSLCRLAAAHPAQNPDLSWMDYLGTTPNISGWAAGAYWTLRRNKNGAWRGVA